MLPLMRLMAGAAASLCLTTAVAWATVFDAGPTDYLALLVRLKPGDTLRLAPGVYLQGLPIHRLNGRAGKPIRIEARDRSERPRFLASPQQSTVSILDSSFVEIVGLELDGLGVPVDAVKAEGRGAYAHHITVADLLIQGYGADQQEVGVSTKCPAWNWVIRGNVIVGAGTGMYLGTSDGTAPFVAGLIEGNLVRDTLGYNLQIKHQSARPEVPGMPAGSSVTIIRHNIFSKANNGSTAGFARPNVLVGHFPLSGRGADDTYLIYGNFFYENPTEALFQGEGNIALYSNVLVNTVGSAINIQPHHARPGTVDVFGNTVVANGNGILITGADSTRSQRVFGNVVFAVQPLRGGQELGNITGGFGDAGQVLTNPFAPPEELDLTPNSERQTRVAHWPALPRSYLDAHKDFDGRTRKRATAGAYVGRPPRKTLSIKREPALLQSFRGSDALTGNRRSR